MLQDQFLPEYGMSSKHYILINQTPERIFSLVDQMDFSDSVVIKILYRLRGLTSAMKTKEGLLRQNFIELGRESNREMVLGLVGQFWKLNGNLKRVTPVEFISFQEKGFLKATWNFSLIPKGENQTLLQTETRVLPFDAQSHRRFSHYWFLIKPFSGMIRKEMLKAIKRKAENS
jgi:hypothetical protein